LTVWLCEAGAVLTGFACWTFFGAARVARRATRFTPRCLTWAFRLAFRTNRRFRRNLGSTWGRDRASKEKGSQWSHLVEVLAKRWKIDATYPLFGHETFSLGSVDSIAMVLSVCGRGKSQKMCEEPLKQQTCPQIFCSLTLVMGRVILGLRHCKELLRKS
jgi:hypothetical protein